MRVISGKSRGTKLEAPEGMNTRPTVDRIKETLFNMISFDIPGCTFLDLFSGSGAIGIEALSRGAKQAVLVEHYADALKCISKNLEKTRLQDDAIVYNIDIYTALQRIHQKNQRFDIIFMDPPYALDGIERVMQCIQTYDLLNEKGYVILERGTTPAPLQFENFELIKEKTYKTTTLSFFERIQ
ncbi:MAG: 16S rRNA (guanine(966)-N(2))-methyltransferase RsmD [Niameybacter sp.]|uniref:16S rRNA (guanine(966)-N(2))-methyltransferase RsmD n=1 Tax=Niameybacter sp. TaxID=2033640 RepID=UPI002FC79D90